MHNLLHPIISSDFRQLLQPEKFFQYPYHMKNYPNATIVVEGHADAKGIMDFNQVLSELRAEVVVNYLVKRELKRSQFTFIGKGESEPEATNNTP